jgi:hypothetical protein
VYVLPQYLGQVQRYNAEQIGNVLAWTGLPHSGAHTVTPAKQPWDCATWAGLGRRHYGAAATDLYLMGRDQDQNVRRGVADANLLIAQGVNCSLSTNNVLNPATPYGDCSLIRMANLHANVLQVRHPKELRECFAMLTERSARLLNLKDYGLGGQSGGRRPLRRADTRAGDRRNPQSGFRVQTRAADHAAPLAPAFTAIARGMLR